MDYHSDAFQALNVNRLRFFTISHVQNSEKSKHNVINPGRRKWSQPLYATENHS